MSATFSGPISRDSIKVSYIDPIEGLVENVSISDANFFERSHPNTTFIFLDGDNKVRYMKIDKVNNLTTKDLISTKVSCSTEPKPCGPPKVVFYGGQGIGAEANPIISPNGTILGIDIINGGYGYKTPPLVKIIDDCDSGSGAVIETLIDRGSVVSGIVKDTGTGYIPSQGASTTYPITLQLCTILVDNPGINYNCGVDEIEVIPNNGIKLGYSCDPFGKIKSVNVTTCGTGYTSPPTIRINSDTGVNATFIPVFTVIRDPITLQIPDQKIIQVTDLVGLTKSGYVGGKPYYGNIYYDNGIKYAGTYQISGYKIRVYDTLQESIK